MTDETEPHPNGAPAPATIRPDPVHQDPAPPASSAAPEPRGGGSGLAIVALIGVLVVAGALYFVWQQLEVLAQRPVETPVDPGRNTRLEAQVQPLTQRLQQLDTRIAAIESDLQSRPAATPAAKVDLGPLEARITALEQRKPSAAPAPDLPAALAPLDKRVAALEQRPAPDPTAALAPLTERLDDLSNRTDELSGQMKTLQGSGADRAAALDKRVTQAEQDAKSGVGRADRNARVTAATAALDAGQPLGAIPDAPPALARFAEARPPTEAALRLSFADMQAKAEAASRPSTESEGIAQRMWQHAQSLVTIREGDKVIVGAPASTILEEARAQLTAGDLGGCVATLKHLDGPAAAAAGDWTSQAQALLDARAALATMARS